MRPVLLVDVDGPINVYGMKTHKRAEKGFQSTPVTVWEGDGFATYPITYNRKQVREIADLSDIFDLVWCTTWNHQANMKIAPLTGLPKFPVLELDLGRRVPRGLGLYWKTPQVVEAFSEGGKFEGRRFAWLDDETTRRDRAHFDGIFGKNFHKLSLVDPHLGFTKELAHGVRRWAQEAAAQEEATGS